MTAQRWLRIIPIAPTQQARGVTIPFNVLGVGMLVAATPCPLLPRSQHHKPAAQAS